MIPMRTFFLALAALFLSAAPAFAHAMLERAEPAVGTRIAAAPARLLLVFSMNVDPALAEIVLTDERGAQIALGALHSGATEKSLEAAIAAALEPGRYHVFWRVVSTDGHKSEGDFSFILDADKGVP